MQERQYAGVLTTSVHVVRLLKSADSFRRPPWGSMHLPALILPVPATVWVFRLLLRTDTLNEVLTHPLYRWLLQVMKTRKQSLDDAQLVVDPECCGHIPCAGVLGRQGSKIDVLRGKNAVQLLT